MASTATATAEYELVLMLDPEIPDERRDQIAADARKRIEAGGELKTDTAWGMRKMAYEIRQRTEADYRFFRFEAGGPPLLDELNHSLRIADGVLRFRIFKVDPRTPVIVPPPPSPLSSGRPERGSRRDGQQRGRGDAPPPAAPPPAAEAPAAEAPAAEAPAAEEEPAGAPEAPVSAPEPPAEAPGAPPEAPETPPAPAEGGDEGEAPADER